LFQKLIIVDFIAVFVVAGVVQVAAATDRLSPR